MILLVDDIRNIEGVDMICRSGEIALEQIHNWEDISSLYLDNDLGEGKLEGYDFLVKLYRINGKVPSRIVLVSSNPIARERIRNFLRDLNYIQAFNEESSYEETWFI
jgi:hypothetical protein